MIFDLNKGEPPVATDQYDVCVCGAGVAGITLARELAKSGKKVALLEAGGRDFSEASQNIYTGNNVGLPYWGLDTCRLRYLGGTSNHWAGQCRPLDALDFEDKEFSPLPGWPISRDELEKFLNPAMDVLELGDQNFDGPAISEWKSDFFRTAGFAFSPPTRFADRYGEELERSGKIDVFINANVTNIGLNSGLDKVDYIDVKNYELDSFRFSSDEYILAFGAIENARILLNNDGQERAGIGNHFGLVGKCFMEHPNVVLGRFVLNEDSSLWKRGGIALLPTNEFAREEKILNSFVSFQPRSIPRIGGRLGPLKTAIRDSVCRSEDLTEFSRKFAEFDCVGDGIIRTQAEQSPNKRSRITLEEKRDYFGLRRVRLDWQLSELDFRTYRILAVKAAQELARQDLGRAQLREFVFDESGPSEVGYYCHHMGTTRMSADSASGVVDSNCKIFGIDNLYIAGSSVFSTSGASNPTFTIVQLTLRLADYLVRIA